MPMNWFDFRESFANEDHKVFGRKLRPFCLYYQFWLSAIESPLLTGEPLSVADLEIASRICSSPFGKAPDSFKKKMGLLAHARWWWKITKLDPLKELQNFQGYLADQFAPPEVKASGGTKTINKGAVGESLPPELAMATSLIRLTGWDEETIWMLPLGKCHWYTASANVLENPDFKLVTQEDRDHVSKIKALQEQGILPTESSPAKHGAV